MIKSSGLITASLFLLCSACSTFNSDLSTNEPISATQALKASQDGSTPDVAGEGIAQVEILSSQNSSSNFRKRTDEIIQGSKLSQQDLGDSKISLIINSIENTEKSSKKPPNFGILVGEQKTPPQYTARAYPVISISSNNDLRHPGTYAFLASETDSLVAGIKHAMIEKQGAIALIVPPRYPSAKISRIKKELGDQTTLNVIQYVASETLWQTAKRAVKTDKKVRIFAFVGNDVKIAPIAKSINTLKGKDKNFSFVGNKSWPTSLIRSQALEGAIVANLDKSGSKLIETRYREKFGEPLTDEALYGYDVMAVVAGIVRSKGIQGLNKNSITDPNGFSGVTGTFRFMADGTVERLYKIHKIKNANLVPIANTRSGF